jgi:hypothetical protein
MLESHESMTQTSGVDEPVEGLEERLLTLIVREYGVVLKGRSLMKVLGYPSLEALRQAIHRNTVPIPLFSLENRKGKGALAIDAARWLAARRAAATTPQQDEQA